MKFNYSQRTKVTGLAALLCLFLGTAGTVQADDNLVKTESKEVSRVELDKKLQEFANSELAIKFKDQVPYFVQENMGVNISGYKLNDLVGQDVFDKLVLVYKNNPRYQAESSNDVRYAIMNLPLTSLTSYDAIAAGKYTPQIFYAGKVFKTKIVGCLRNSLAESNFNYCLVQFHTNPKGKERFSAPQDGRGFNGQQPDQERQLPPVVEGKQAPNFADADKRPETNGFDSRPDLHGKENDPRKPNEEPRKDNKGRDQQPQDQRPDFKAHRGEQAPQEGVNPPASRSEGQDPRFDKQEDRRPHVEGEFNRPDNQRPRGSRPNFIPAPNKLFQFNTWAFKGAVDSGKYFDASKYASPVEGLPKTGAFRLYNFSIVTSEQDGKKEYKLTWDQGVFVPEEISDVTTDGKPGLINPVYQKNPVFPIYRDAEGKMDNSVILFPAEEQRKLRKGDRPENQGSPKKADRFEKQDKEQPQRPENSPSGDKADPAANVTLQGYPAKPELLPQATTGEPQPAPPVENLASVDNAEQRAESKDFKNNPANFIAFRTFNRYDLYQEHAFFSTKEDVEFDAFYKRGEDGFNLNIRDFNTLARFSRMLGGVAVAMQDKQYEHLDQYAEQPVPYLPRPGEVLASTPVPTAKLSIYRNNFVGNQVYILSSSPQFFYGDELGSFDGSGTYDFSVAKLKALLATIDRSEREIEVDVRRVGRYRAFKIPYAPQFQPPRDWLRGEKGERGERKAADFSKQKSDNRNGKRQGSQQGTKSPDPRPLNSPPPAENPQNADVEKQD